VESTIGVKRWLRIHELIHKGQQIKDYMGVKLHRSCWESVVKTITRRHPYSKWLNASTLENSNDDASAEEKKDTTEERKRKHKMIKKPNVNIKTDKADSRAPGDSPKRKGPKTPGSDDKSKSRSPQNSSSKKYNSSVASVAVAKAQNLAKKQKQKIKNKFKSPRSGKVHAE